MGSEMCIRDRLNLAATYGHTEIYKFLTKKVENFNAPNPVDGFTPLHYAAWNGYTEMFKFIASKVENPNLPKQDGWTPINLAAKYGQFRCRKKFYTCVPIFNHKSNSNEDIHLVHIEPKIRSLEPL